MTVQAVYTILQYTVRFVINSATVKVMTVNYGYVLQESDYPEIPPRAGLVGHWRKYTAPICENVTIPAAYCAAYHTVTFSVPDSSFLNSSATVVKEMTVSDGYKLVASDYPPVPPRSGYSGSWRQFTEEIHSDISISAIYEVAPTIPVQPTNPSAIMSVDDPDDIAEEPTNELIASVYTTVSSDAVRTEITATAGSNAVTDSIREGQVLVSTQTVQHDYITQNGKVVRETVRTNGTVTAVMDFIYDESGTPFALKYSTNGGSSFTTYYYVVNLQGDVVKLVNASGTAYATYTYNAWGEVLTATGTMASINPLRYRGYYYDSETGFYYLQSRYYDPVTHRFINADAFASTGQGFTGTNMFAYCGNNPVLNIDPSGQRFIGSNVRYYGNGLYGYTDTATGYNASNISCVDPPIRDVTNEINAALSRAAEEARVYREHSYCSSFCVDCCIDCITVEKQRYMSFYNLVNHHAPWDIKEEASWKTTIGTEFPGYNVQVKYCGMLMTPEALGNYTYGYLGRAYGIPLDFLCTGSWYAAGFPTSGSALDNERIDQEYIKFGYFCYYTLAID